MFLAHCFYQVAEFGGHIPNNEEGCPDLVFIKEIQELQDEMEGFVWDIDPTILMVGPLQIRYYGRLLRSLRSSRINPTRIARPKDAS